MIQGFPRKRSEQPNGALGRQGFNEVLVADVLFGSPNKNCAGAGICRVTAPVAQELSAEGRWGCHRAIALVRAVSPTAIVFHFVLQSMCRKAIKAYFTGDTFLVEDPFEFQPDYWSKGQPITIQPGVYPVVRSKDYLTVAFEKEMEFGNKFFEMGCN
ncbi:MAG: hypothetical protein KDD02_01465 [Phaeodactylibacter sp.]|nr:hypothetical protein [Phaeodactylibacter sp.]MCB9299090.1 hypothetical protein [Lewinellaceae bacterium]